MRGCARKMEDQLVLFDEISKVLNESHTGYMQWLAPMPITDKVGLLSFRRSLESLLDRVRAASRSQEEWRNNVLGLKGISQELNTAAARLGSVIGEIARVLRKNEEWCTTILRMIDDKLGQ